MKVGCRRRLQATAARSVVRAQAWAVHVRSRRRSEAVSKSRDTLAGDRRLSILPRGIAHSLRNMCLTNFGNCDSKAKDNTHCFFPFALVVFVRFVAGVAWERI